MCRSAGRMRKEVRNNSLCIFYHLTEITVIKIRPKQDDSEHTMTTIDEIYPSKYLKATDIDGSDLVVTISKADVEVMGLGDRADQKIVLYFQETDKGLPLNKTNAIAVGQLYGRDIENWVGKRVALFPTEVSFQGKQYPSIRVRMKPPTDQYTQLTQQFVAKTEYNPLKDGPKLFED